LDIRIIYSVALKCLATSIIISHNHPSNSAKPSKSDIKLTENLKKAGELLNIDLMDHIIITKESFYSLKANNDM